MSMLPTTDRAPSIRIPKLKVRSRGPSDPVPSNGEPAQTHQSQPSGSGTIATVSDESDTAASTAIHSPKASTFHTPHASIGQSSIGQTSPTSPGYPVRIPKLAVRNRASDDEAPHGAFKFPLPTPPAADDADAIRPAPNQTSSGAAYPLAGVTTHSSHTSDASALTTGNLSQKDAQASGSGTKKKKMNSLFGFLTLKEPSALALEHFAENQRKQAELKGNRLTAVGLPGITDRKLPPGVPKVNSKWDGLPDWAREAAKEAKKERKASDPLLTKMAQSRRPSSNHGSVSTFESESSRGPPNSLTSSTKAHLDAKGRPSSQKSSNSKDSASRLRNPSKARSSSKKRLSPSRLNQSKTPPGDVPDLPDPSSYFPTQQPPWLEPPGVSQSSNTSPSETLPHTPVNSALRPSLQPIAHGHSRSVSDPRLNVGMDNVAPLTFFGTDGSLPTLALSTSPESQSPPIPRKSSRRSHSRQLSSTSTKDSALDLTLTRFATAPASPSYNTTMRTSSEIVTPDEEPDISAFPLPPSSIKSSLSDSRSQIATPVAMKAILPEDTSDTALTSAALAAALSSSPPVACGEITPAYPTRNPRSPQRKTSASFSLTPKISNSALNSGSPGRAGSPLGFAHARSNSISAALPPTGAAHSRNTSFTTSTSPTAFVHARGPSWTGNAKKAADIVPWEVQDVSVTPQASAGAEATVKDAPKSPVEKERKKSRLSSFGLGKR